MKKALLLLIAPLLLLTACNDDDNNNNNPEGISGNWHLVNVMMGFSGQSANYQRGQVVYNFNTGTNKLTVMNNINESALGLASGTYDYNIGVNENVCDSYLSIPMDGYEYEMGCTQISGDTLISTTAYVDGPAYLFVR